MDEEYGLSDVETTIIMSTSTENSNSTITSDCRSSLGQERAKKGNLFLSLRVTDEAANEI
jgi:hypothetical protein